MSRKIPPDKKDGLRHRRVLLVDGECILCHRAIQFVNRYYRSGDLYFGTLQSPDLPLWIRKEIQGVDSVVLVDHGAIISSSRAVFNIASRMRFPWNSIVIFQLFPRKLTDAIYQWVASKRFTIWGRKASCSLPDSILQSRILFP